MTLSHLLKGLRIDLPMCIGLVQDLQGRRSAPYQLLQNPSLHAYNIYVIVFPYPPGRGMGTNEPS